jgi:hypothetical protein
MTDTAQDYIQERHIPDYSQGARRQESDVALEDVRDGQAAHELRGTKTATKQRQRAESRQLPRVLGAERAWMKERVLSQRQSPQLRASKHWQYPPQ